ncbi:MAG: sigma-70 family RNA polymerase sigma factor [Planctomycetes bacterium]|nr:sigma-70 family RNA polymerase sigma factor [Planctomycetota bacterium]
MSDNELSLQLDAENQDPDFFAQLVKQHTGLVYRAGLRITGNIHDAEDVAQECFLVLARKAGTITSSLPAWLHFTAMNCSKDIIRNKSLRRHHERLAVLERKPNNKETTWLEIEQHVDEALTELPEDLRTPIILHYFEEMSQTEIAEELAIGQATVSRRIKKGIIMLRQKLKQTGVLTSTMLLTSLLLKNAAAAAIPQTLKVNLVKMALAGIGKGAAATAGSTGALGGAIANPAATAILTGSIKAKIVAATLAGVLAVGGVTTYKRMKPEEKPVEISSFEILPGNQYPIFTPSPEKSGEYLGEHDQAANKQIHKTAVNQNHENPMTGVESSPGDDTAVDISTLSALHQAAYGGHVKQIEELLLQGAEVNGAGWEGRTPLHLAALGGHPLTCEFLISSGAIVDALDENGQTPLHLAASKGHRATCELLLANGAGINTKDNQCDTPERLAENGGHDNLTAFLKDQEY